MREEIKKENVETQYEDELKRLKDAIEEKKLREFEKSRNPKEILGKLKKEKDRKLKDLKAREKQMKEAKKEKEEIQKEISKHPGGVFAKIPKKDKNKLTAIDLKIEKIEQEKKKLEKPFKKLEEEIEKLEKLAKNKKEAKEKLRKDIEDSKKFEEELQIEREVEKSRKSNSSEILNEYSKIFNIQKELKKAIKDSNKYKSLSEERASLYDKLSKDNRYTTISRRKARELISKRFKEMNKERLREKYKDLFNLKSEEIMSNNRDKKSELENKVKKVYQKLKDDKNFNKEIINELIEQYRNFSNKQKIEHNSKKLSENIEEMREKQIKSLQEKHNAISIEKTSEPIQTKDSVEITSIDELIKQSKGKNISKNLLKKYLSNSLATVDEKDKDKLKKIYKKLYTPGIKNSPKTKKELQEIFNKFKKIEQNKVKKVNRNTNELATPELPKDTPPFFQRFAPKPEISPWAKKATKNSSSIATNTVKPTFSKDSSKRIDGKSYKNSLGIKKALLISPPQENSSPIKKNSNFTRVPYKTDEKIIKLIKKLPSRTIKIKDIKSKILSVQNKETQRQLRSLLDQKLISITRK